MTRLSHLLLIALVPCFTQCTSSKRTTKRTAQAPAATLASPPVKKATPAATNTAPAPTDYDDLDEYAVVEISDPLEKMNRGIFWVNDQSYRFIFRPISKGYEKVLPNRLRKGIHNAFENARFPIRFVNSALQGDFKKAGLHVGKFVIDTVAGVGGLVKRSDEIPVFAALPDEDTGKTFAKWGMGHGPYLVIPFLGPSSLRDGVGLGADYAMNPVNFALYVPGKYDWGWIPPTANSLRMLPVQLSTYDETVRDSIDPYIAVRSAYVQFRDEFVKK